MLGKPITLRGLAALQSASLGAWQLLPFESVWFWFCTFSWILFLLTTTGFNTILLRASVIYKSVRMQAELGDWLIAGGTLQPRHGRSRKTSRPQS